MLLLIIKTLIINYVRSLQQGRLVTTKVIFIILITIPVVFAGIVSGLMLATILEKFYSSEKSIALFGLGFIFVLVVSLLLLPIMSEGHKMSLAPYLHLPVKKTHLAHLYQLTNFISIWNGLLFILLFSFFGYIFFHFNSPFYFGYIILFIWLLIISNQLIIIFRFLLLNKKIIWFIACGLVILIIAFLFKYQETIQPILLNLFQLIADGNWNYIIIFYGFGILIYAGTFKLIIHWFYIDSYSSKKKLFSGIKFLKKGSPAFHFGWLQIRQLLRTKRGPIFLLENILFYFMGFSYLVQGIQHNDFFYKIFGELFLFTSTGIFYAFQNYRFLSRCFDSIYLRYNGLEQLTKSSVGISYIMSTFNFILSMILAYYLEPTLWLLFIAVWIYNLGFTNYIFLFMATFETNGYNLNVNPVLNFKASWNVYQLSNLLGVIIVIIIPFLLLFITRYIYGLTNILSLTIIGLSGIVSTRFWLRKIIRSLSFQRYKILNGFRS